MNKILKTILAIMGAIDVVIYISTPIILALLLMSVFGVIGFGSYLFNFIALISTFFRAIKIGWIKK